VIKLPKPHPAQRRVLRERRRFNVLAMGRRWGKTTLGVRLLKHALNTGRPVAWFAPTYKLLDEAWRETLRLYELAIIRQDVQQRRLELAGGGSIEFWSLDRHDPARGRKYSLVIIDEAAMVRDLADKWQAAIRPTLTDYSGTAWFLSTPRGQDYYYELYQHAGEADNWARWQMPTAANPHIDPEEIEAARRELPELVFAQEYLAQFVDVSGGRIRREWIRYGTPPDGLEPVMGVDLAISERQGADYTAVAVLARDDEGRVWVLAVERVRTGFAGVLQLIRQQAERWQPRVIAIEQTQYQAAVVQELARTTTLNVRGVRPDRDKLTRFMPLETRYQQGLVYHGPLVTREYEDELVAFPLGAHDDQVDAVAYAWRALDMAASPDDLRRAYGW